MAAANGVKVMLDGQGADELLAGYSNFYGALFAGLFLRGRWLPLLAELVAYKRINSQNNLTWIMPQELMETNVTI